MGAAAAAPWLQAAGTQAAGQAAGAASNAIMGIVFGGLNDRRQIRQQRRLNELANAQTEFNMQKQLEMWEATGYVGQKEQMKRAGINPALMYGMSGGGGQTAGINTGAAGAAPGGGGEIMGMMGMGLQMQLMKAQKDLLESQAKKNNVEAEKTAGVDTREGEARIDMLMQGVDNARQQNEIQKLEITLKNIENFEKQASQVDRLDYIRYQTRQAERQLQIVSNEAYISSATMREKVKIVQQEAIGAVLRNALVAKQTEATGVGMAVDQQKIKESINQIMQNWDRMEQGNKELLIKDVLKQYNTDPTVPMTKQMMDMIGDAMRISVH